MESDGEPTYTNKVDIWSMGCILYELATGNRPFRTDWQVLAYLSSRKNKDVVLDHTFDAHSIEIIGKHIADMLQIQSSARPSASVLSKEFTRECQLLEMSHPDGQQLNCVSSSTEQTQLRLENRQVSESDNSTPILPSHLIGVSLYSLAERGDVEAVKILLNAKVDVNAQGGLYGNALQAASRDGHEDVVRLLLDKGADVNAQGGHYGNALQAASRDRHEAVVRLLLDKGAVYVRG